MAWPVAVELETRLLDRKLDTVQITAVESRSHNPSTLFERPPPACCSFFILALYTSPLRVCHCYPRCLYNTL